jgi:hypothetical protein
MPRSALRPAAFAAAGGLWLIMYELAHIVQQSRGRRRELHRISEPPDG